jgi:hypothetical protein
VQFIQNISEAAIGELDNAWLRWGASSMVSNAAPKLHAMIAGRSYLVHAENALTWKVQGIPLLKPIEWRSDRLNLVGFAVDESAPPTFASFFADCDEVDLSKIYRLNSSGIWTPAATSDAMQAGEAFWIQTTNGVPEFQGAVSVSAGSRHGLDYGKTVVELPINMNIEGAADTEIFIEPLPSEINTDSAEYPAVAGPVPLMWWNPNAPDSSVGKWERLTNEVSTVLPGTNTTALRFAVLRRELADYAAPAGTDPIYTRLLHIGDGSSLSVNVPVRALGTSVQAGMDDMPFDATGLWFGNVVVDEVSQPYPAGSEGTHPVAEGSEYSFRIILHSSTNGVSLLSRAALVWQDGSYGAPNEEGYRTMESPGRYLIVGNDALLPGLLAGGTDNELNRRISSAAFSHPLPIVAIDSTTNSIRFVVQTAHNDPRSPFVHTYHPMHDSKNAGVEMFVTNAVTITNFLERAGAVSTSTPTPPKVLLSREP